MKEDLSLVIMAAGLGTRYGGLKQIEKVGPNDEIIMDYSIYDAIEAGFNHIVFVIKEEHYDLFKNLIGDKTSKKVDVSYAFQSTSDVPEKVKFMDRKKPWGTAQAVMCTKPYVNGKFAIINADDFYGKNAYQVLATSLKELKKDEGICITYKYDDTRSEYGAVKRGVLKVEDGYITELIECQIEKKNDKIIAKPLSGDDELKINENTPVSMNMFGFNNSFYDVIDEYLQKFFLQTDEILQNAEALIPDIIKEKLKEKNLKLCAIPSNSKWSGITYKEDLEELKNVIKIETDKGNYQNI